MRKVFTIIIVLFVIVAGLIIYFSDTVDNQISILSIHKNYSRLITSDTEQITLTIYLSSDDSFITDIESISSSFIRNDRNQIETEIKNINNLDYEEDFGELKYYAYTFVIGFKNSLHSDSFVEIDNAYLVINYANGDSIDIEVGNLYLRFSPILNEMHLDMSRLYAVMKQLETFEYISGIVIGLDNISMQDLKITSVSSGITEMQFDLDNSIMLDIAPEYNQDIDNILGYHYEPINPDIEDETLLLETNHLIFIPLAYIETIIEINRFPLIIEYQYLGDDYIYMIDDFQYYSDILTLEGNYGKIREYIYNY
ncbi:hypothetical protein RJI07_00455 [Mycoplasmatota bacterium WC30]